MLRTMLSMLLLLLLIWGSLQMQGAFRQVAVEADACAKELTLILKQRMVTQKDEAAECIQMVRKLGEPIESLQVSFFCLFACMAYLSVMPVVPCLPAGPPCMHCLGCLCVLSVCACLLWPSACVSDCTSAVPQYVLVSHSLLVYMPPVFQDSDAGRNWSRMNLFLQEDFLLCMHKRMEDILHEAEAIADLMSPAANPAALQGQIHSCTLPCQCIIRSNTTNL